LFAEFISKLIRKPIKIMVFGLGIAYSKTLENNSSKLYLARESYCCETTDGKCGEK